MPPSSRSTNNTQRYLRRATSGVELNERIDPGLEERSISWTRGAGPSQEWDKDKVLLAADEFVTLFDLDDIRDVVRKGALLYFDPDDLERVDDVTRDELAALSGKTDEKEEFEGWSLGPYACYMAAVLFASLQDADLSGWRAAIWLGYIWIICAPLWCALSVPLNRYLGRRRAIRTAAILALSPALANIVAGRSLNSAEDFSRVIYILIVLLSFVSMMSGAAIMILGCTIPLYLAETSVAASRGRKIATWQFGVLFVRCLFCVQRRLFPLRSDPEDILFLADFITIVAALILLGLVSGERTPESPYWCVSNGKIRQAFKSLCYFRRAKIIAARDLCQIYFARVQGGRGQAQHPTSTSRLPMAEADSQFRRAMVALAGILLTRSMTAFQDARAQLYFWTVSDLDGHSLGALVTIFSLTFVGVLAVRIDKIGRRSALLILTPLLLLLMQVLENEPDPEDPLSDSFVGQVVYRALYQAGEAIYIVYAAEVFPVQRNDTGMAVAVSVNCGSFALVTLSASISGVLGEGNLQHYVSILLFIFILLLWLGMRETKNVPIGDMASVFDVPTRNLVLYRVRVYLPYLFKRHILRKDVAIVPLEESRYKFAPIALDGAEMSLDHRS